MSEAIALNEYKIISEFISKDSDNFSPRFLQIIQSAASRAEAAEAFFVLAAQNAFDRASRSFFRRLADKKALHGRIIEKIGINANLLSGQMNHGESVYLESSLISGDPYGHQVVEPANHLRNIFEMVYEKTMDELNFYLNFLFIEKHPIIASLLFSMANLSRDFLFEVKIGYLELLSKIEMGDSEKVVEHFFKLEKRFN